MSMKAPVHLKQPFDRERKNASLTTVSGRLYDELTYIPTGVKTVITDAPEYRAHQNWDTMNDVVTPGFRAIQARGGLVNSPMSKTSLQLTVGGTGSEATFFAGGSYTEQYLHSNGTIFILFGEPIFAPMTIDLDNLIRFTKTNALSKCRSSSMMGLVAIAEMRKTINMLKHPLDSISTLLSWIEQNRKAKRNLVVELVNGEARLINGRRVPGGTKVYKRTTRSPGKVIEKSKRTVVVPLGEAISGSVLANNLGLRPLLMDIDAILHQIPNAHKQDLLTFRSNAADEEKAVVVSSQLNIGGMYVKTKTTTTNKVTVRSNVMIRDHFSVSEDFGVSLADLPEAAWELIPYSFVLDYVVNVGDYLGALRALATQEILLGSTTYTIEQVAVRETIDPTPAANWTIVTAPTGKDVLTRITKVRSPGVGLPEGLAVLPQSKAITPAHLQNTLSLIVQQLTRIQRGPGRKETPFF